MEIRVTAVKPEWADLNGLHGHIVHMSAALAAIRHLDSRVLERGSIPPYFLLNEQIAGGQELAIELLDGFGQLEKMELIVRVGTWSWCGTAAYYRRFVLAEEKPKVQEEVN